MGGSRGHCGSGIERESVIKAVFVGLGGFLERFLEPVTRTNQNARDTCWFELNEICICNFLCGETSADVKEKNHYIAADLWRGGVIGEEFEQIPICDAFRNGEFFREPRSLSKVCVLK